MINIKRTYDRGFTIGALSDDKGRLDNTTIYTLELPNINNQRFVSCIPEGEYILKKHISPKFGKCFKVFDNNGIDEVCDRSNILVHSGNVVNDTLGCILVGLDKRKDCVLDSRKALRLLMDILDSIEELRIVNY